jgi:hypothetical protein
MTKCLLVKVARLRSGCSVGDTTAVDAEACSAISAHPSEPRGFLGTRKLSKEFVELASMHSRQ